MPGQMNVLLAKLRSPTIRVRVWRTSTATRTTDDALVLGANDVVNPLAHEKGSPIYGMPIIEAHKARTVIVNKRSMAAGLPPALDKPAFYMDKTMMVFGDAKKVVERHIEGARVSGARKGFSPAFRKARSGAKQTVAAPSWKRSKPICARTARDAAESRSRSRRAVPRPCRIHAEQRPNEVAAKAKVPAAVARYLESGNLPLAGCVWPQLADLDWKARGSRFEPREANGSDAIGVSGAFRRDRRDGTLVFASGPIRPRP